MDPPFLPQTQPPSAPTLSVTATATVATTASASGTTATTVPLSATNYPDSIAGQQQECEGGADGGFMAQSSLPPLSVSIMPVPSPVVVGVGSVEYQGNNTCFMSNDEKSDHGGPVGAAYMKQPLALGQTQQKSGGGGSGDTIDLPPPDSVSRERSNEEDVYHQRCCGRDNIVEAKKQLWLAGPLIAVSILQYCLQIISIMYVGHLGELTLSGTSMASSFASVTGFSVLLGMGSALETFCGQAYGARQYHLLGVFTQRAMLTLLVVSLPLAMIWYYTDTILVAVGQDPEISAEAGTFNRWMIPSLFAYGLLQCLNRFLQTQNNVFPMLVSSGVTALVHVLVCWALVFHSGLGSKGAALSITVSYWVNVCLLAIYIKLSSTCSETWNGFSKEALHDILGFVKLAVPSAVMICLEYWSFEMVVLLSGRLPNPKLETSVLSICLNTCWMVYMISVGLGGAISTRVSNELGAGRPQVARLALRVMIVIALSEGAAVGIATILVRQLWGKLYSNEKEVIRYVATMMPLLALSDFLDGFQCVLSGAARGCGWQKLCAVINLGAYYFVAIPCAVVFAFVFRIGGMGLWMGIICGLLVQIVALIIVNARTNWEREASKLTTSSGNQIALTNSQLDGDP